MLLDYITSNYITLTVLLFLAVIMYVNKDSELPASKLFFLAICLLLGITVFEQIESYTFTVLTSGNVPDINFYRGLHLAASIMNYIIRPAIIMLELLLIMPEIKYKLLCTIPSVINAVIYLLAPVYPQMIFGYDDNNLFFRGILGYTVFSLLSRPTTPKRSR